MSSVGCFPTRLHFVLINGRILFLTNRLWNVEPVRFQGVWKCPLTLLKIVPFTIPRLLEKKNAVKLFRMTSPQHLHVYGGRAGTFPSLWGLVSS